MALFLFQERNMINIRRQIASISPEFKDAIMDISRHRITNMKDSLPQYNTRERRENFMEQNKGLLVNAGKMITSPTFLDEVESKLRSLEFVSFHAETVSTVHKTASRRDMTPMLVAKTKPVSIRTGRSLWDMGAYTVYIPIKSLKNSSYAEFHFVPEYKPMTNSRHPHHTAWDITGIIAAVPTEKDPHVCWGGFNGIIGSLVSDFDIVEIFRIITVYLGRYNAGSPLAKMENIEWKRIKN
jgi:hypothetical protein